MKAKWLPISAAVALALGSFSASAVDFHGYFRAGVQNNLTNGGAVYCFGNGVMSAIPMLKSPFLRKYSTRPRTSSL